MAKLFLFDPESKWAAPAAQLISDNDGFRCAYSGKAIHEMVKDGTVSSKCKVVSESQVIKLCKQRARELYCKGPEKIDAERFDEMLNILPPERWQKIPGGEMFRVSEMISNNIYGFYLRIGQEYWQINEDGDIKAADLVRLCV